MESGCSWPGLGYSVHHGVLVNSCKRGVTKTPSSITISPIVRSIVQCTSVLPYELCDIRLSVQYIIRSYLGILRSGLGWLQTTRLKRWISYRRYDAIKLRMFPRTPPYSVLRRDTNSVRKWTTGTQQHIEPANPDLQPLMMPTKPFLHPSKTNHVSHVSNRFIGRIIQRIRTGSNTMKMDKAGLESTLLHR